MTFRARAAAAAAKLLTTVAVAGIAAWVASPDPAIAQSAASSIDQPTPATLPPGTSTTKGGADPSAHRATGGVAPPAAISSSTDVMEGGGKGADTGRPKSDRTDPLDHLSPEYKR